LKDNDFLVSISTGFLYTPEASTLQPCSVDPFHPTERQQRASQN
jgi:hypothetical protein